jgi:transcriptional regulator with XRE-family HTH domain
MATVGQRLKVLRELLGLSQKEFAEKIGVHWMTVSRYELGKSKPKWDFLKRVMETFNVNPIWLSEGKGDVFLVKTTKGNISSLYSEFDNIMEKHALPIASFIADLLIKQTLGSKNVTEKFRQRLTNSIYRNLTYTLRLKEELLRDTLLNITDLITEDRDYENKS